MSQFFSGTIEAGILKFGIQMDNKVLYCGIANLKVKKTVFICNRWFHFDFFFKF